MQDLSLEITKGINLLGNSKEIPDAGFKPLTELAFAVILRRADESKINGLWVVCGD
jgi:hypothetical protein